METRQNAGRCDYSSILSGRRPNADDCHGRDGRRLSGRAISVGSHRPDVFWMPQQRHASVALRLAPWRSPWWRWQRSRPS